MLSHAALMPTMILIKPTTTARMICVERLFCRGFWLFFAVCIRQLFCLTVSPQEFNGDSFILLNFSATGDTQPVEVVPQVRVCLSDQATQQELNLLMLFDIPIDVDAKAEMIIALMRFKDFDEPRHT